MSGFTSSLATVLMSVCQHSPPPPPPNGQNWGCSDESDTPAVPRTQTGKSVLVCPCVLGLEGIHSWAVQTLTCSLNNSVCRFVEYKGNNNRVLAAVLISWNYFTLCKACAYVHVWVFTCVCVHAWCHGQELGTSSLSPVPSQVIHLPWESLSWPGSGMTQERPTDF